VTSGIDRQLLQVGKLRWPRRPGHRRPGYNQVDLCGDKTGLKSLWGSEVIGNPNPANGFQGAFATGQYFNAFAGQGEGITRVVVRSDSDTFETDNHAVLGVHVPGSCALMLAGRGVLGFAAGRRRSV
jgi:hypothetical protein